MDDGRWTMGSWETDGRRVTDEWQPGGNRKCRDSRVSAGGWRLSNTAPVPDSCSMVVLSIPRAVESQSNRTVYGTSKGPGPSAGPGPVEDSAVCYRIRPKMV